MTKMIPDANLTFDLVAPSAKAMTDALKTVEATKGADMYMVDPTQLDYLPDFNVRVRSSEAWEEQVKALMDSIRANGFRTDKPISVVAHENEGKVSFIIVDGHTRHEAVCRLIDEGVEIEKVPVVLAPKNTTFEDMLVGLVSTNTGKPLTPYETSLVVKRLQNYGWEDGKIAERLGFSKTYVANLTVLAGAPAKVRNQVIAGKLAATEAMKLLRKHGQKAVEVVEAAAEAAKKAGKEKITGKATKKAAKDTGATETAGKGKGKGKATAKVAPEPFVLTDRHAIDYACDVAADGVALLKLYRAGDKDTLAEIEAYYDPHGGL